MLRGKCEVAIHHPGVIAGVLSQDLGDGATLVLAEVEDRAILVVIDHGTHGIDVAVHAGEVLQPSHIVLEVVVAVELRLQHLVGGTDVAVGRMCAIELLAAIETIGGHEGARLLLVEDVLHVDEVGIVRVEADACAQKLLDEQGNVEAVGVVACEVAALEDLFELLGELLERGLVGHHLVGDMVDGSRFGGDVHLGVDEEIARFLLTIGHHLDVTELDDSVTGDTDTSGFEVEEDEGFLEMEFHKRCLEVGEHHRHDEHEQLFALVVLHGGYEASAGGIAEQHLDVLRGDGVEDFDEEVGAESDAHRDAFVGAGERLGAGGGVIDILGRDGETACLEVELDLVGGAVGEDGDATQGGKERLAIDGEAVGIVLGNDHLVARIASLDEGADELVVAQLEVCALGVEADGAKQLVLGDDVLEEVGRFLGQDEVGLEAGGGHLVDETDELLGVGGDEDDAVGLDVEIDAVHDGTELVLGSGKEGALYAIEERLSIDLETAGTLFEGLDARILVGIATDEVVLTIGVADDDLVVAVIYLDGELLLRHLLERVHDGLGGHHEGACSLDVVDGDGGDHGSAAIAGGNGKPFFADVETEVIEDRQGVLAQQHAADGVQMTHEVGTEDFEFHSVSI